MPKSHREPDAAPRAPDGGRARELLARKWSSLLKRVVVVDFPGDELDRELREQLDGVCAALLAEPFTTAPLELLGERLVGLGHVGEEALATTADVLGRGLLALPELQPVERFAERVVVGLGALSAGFAAAARRVVLDQQETMRLSLLKAVRDAKGDLRESEARFEQVATSCSSGILVVDLDGRVVRANTAIGQILGRPAAELTGVELFDLVHPDSARALRRSVEALLSGASERVRVSQRLLRADGDVARISLTASLLRDAEDAPNRLVVVVEDGTELTLLRGELHRQALHDVLTGLPNRQFFSTHLESALRRADPVRGLTLLQLDIDAFGMVCGSLGHAVGERLLLHVAQRLQAVLAGEKAMVARFDGDEFGVLLENSATTPDIATTVAAINAELAEPVYLDGHGLAVSVSIGVVRALSPDDDPAELLREADLVLRRAKRGRRGQWELYDPARDEADRRARTQALDMPGAWEHGEIGVRYRPVVGLADGGTAGVEAVLRWDPPGCEPVPHHRCAELAERTGLILPLGEWLLRIAVGQAAWWSRLRAGADLPLEIGLTAHQATDADLVSRVVRALDSTGLSPDRLGLGVPVGALAVAEAVDNLTVLAEMGVRVGLEDFGLGPDDLAAVEDLPVRRVRVARRLVERQVRTGSAYVAALVPSVRRAGVDVVVDGVESWAQADWWRAAGAQLATGDRMGAPCEPGEITAFF